MLFGGNYIEIPVSVQTLGAFWAGALRLGLASLSMLVLTLAIKGRFPRGRAIPFVLLYGSLGFSGNLALLYLGEVKVSPDTAVVVFASSPLWVMLFSRVVRTEKLSLKGAIGAFVAFFGVAVIFEGALSQNVPYSYLLLVLGGAVSYSVGLVAFAKAKEVDPQIDPLAVNCVAFALAACILLALALLYGEVPSLPSTSDAQFAIVYLVFATVVGYGILATIIKKIRATYAAYSSILIPVVTIIESSLIGLREPTAWFYVGVVIITIGVLASGELALPLSRTAVRETSNMSEMQHRH